MGLEKKAGADDSGPAWPEGLSMGVTGSMGILNSSLAKTQRKKKGKMEEAGRTVRRPLQVSR